MPDRYMRLLPQMLNNLWAVAEVAAGLSAARRDAGDEGGAGGGGLAAGQDAQRGGLAGTIGPQEAETLAAGDAEAQALQGRLPCTRSQTGLQSRLQRRMDICTAGGVTPCRIC